MRVGRAITDIRRLAAPEITGGAGAERFAIVRSERSVRPFVLVDTTTNRAVRSYRSGSVAMSDRDFLNRWCNAQA
jgi:hypothetical protein